MIQLSDGRMIPLDMHKVKVFQKLPFPNVDQRLDSIRGGGFNTFLLRSSQLFLDMLTDSGTNAQSDKQMGAMMEADDAYAGSESFYKLEKSVQDIFKMKYTLPVHQGRAAEHMIAKCFVKEGDYIPMNQHFTTTRAHFGICIDEAFNTESDYPFKGNLDIDKFEALIEKVGKENIPFVRMEAPANLLGGHPFSMANLRAVKRVAALNGIKVFIDTSLIGDNAYLIKMREPEYKNKSIAEIIEEMLGMSDLIYMSARKSCMSRGGLIATNSKDMYSLMAPLIPVYEGFLIYGGISTREIESMAVGLREMTDTYTAGSATDLIDYFVTRLKEEGIPVVTPPGAVGAHIDACKFLPNLKHEDYPAGDLAAAIFIVSGARGMERGTISTDRLPDGTEVMSELELVRLAVPRRTFTMSHIEYVVDRIKWLYENRHLVGGLAFDYDPEVLRFFIGRLVPKEAGGVDENWDETLAKAFKEAFDEHM